MSEAIEGRARGGIARAARLSKEQRKAISERAIEAKKELAFLPKATHGSVDRPLRIGTIEIPCYVLDDGTRMLSQRGLIAGIGMSTGSTKSGDARPVAFFELDAIKPFANNDLAVMLRSPIRFRPPHGGRPAYGYPATILADICEAVLAARKAGALPPRQTNIAEQCEILVRGFARVGIIALVDEATGYQKDRAKDALATILEAFIAKELQPWVRTFPAEYYEEMFRLRGLNFPGGSVKRPQYFGVLTNDAVYRRLAPGVLEELRRVTPRNDDGRPTAKYFQSLTSNIGYPKLREHIGKVIAMMQLSEDWADFKLKIDRLLPVQTDQLRLTLEEPDENDSGVGL
jgi:hypothetical protein